MHPTERLQFCEDIGDYIICRYCSGDVYPGEAFCSGCGKANPEFDQKRFEECAGQSYENAKKITCSSEGHSAAEEAFCTECGKRILPN